MAVSFGQVHFIAILLHNNFSMNEHVHHLIASTVFLFNEQTFRSIAHNTKTFPFSLSRRNLILMLWHERAFLARHDTVSLIHNASRYSSLAHITSTHCTDELMEYKQK